MTETEETVLDLRSVIELVIADLRTEKNAWAGSGAYAPMNSAANRLAAALSRVPEDQELGSSTRMTSPASRSQTPLSAGWRVKDLADGWIYFATGEEALAEVAAMGGALIEPALPNTGGEID
ncbi:MAG: hypothetical protein V4820_11915 [Pseudomonadota bacterium]